MSTAVPPFDTSLLQFVHPNEHFDRYSENTYAGVDPYALGTQQPLT